MRENRFVESVVAISVLTIADLGPVDDLMKRHSSTLGFLPRAALGDYLEKQGVLGAKNQEGRLVGYLMYAANSDRFRIAQLCVAETLRGQGIGRKLLDALRTSATTQKVMTLRCRNDFLAHGMWPKLGFVPIDESPGRSKEGHLLTFWRLQIASPDQLELFRAHMSDEVLDTAIDTQILLDFDRPDSDRTQPSKAMISDLFVDSVNLWFTDELLSEINRSPSSFERERARTRARQLFEVRYDPPLVEDFVARLKEILPSQKANQLSDIRHLAKTAASPIGTFVTRDRLLLREAPRIHQAVGVQVVSPTRLIVRLRELSEAQPYVVDHVSGPSLSWRRLTSDNLSTFAFDRFIQHGERPRELETRVNSLLSGAPEVELEVLWSGSEPIACRVLTYDSPETVTVSLCRVSSSVRLPWIRRFPLADVINRAIVKGLDAVKVTDFALSVDLLSALPEMGFTRCASGFVRFCFTRPLTRGMALARIAGLFPECAGHYDGMSRLDLERACSPLILDEAQGYYLIPIRPSYARDLLDRRLSSEDMFGGDPDVLLRWSNVYYRARTQHKALTAPGRILWYVSGASREIAAISHLDEVVIDRPKELFRRFRRYGAFEWKQLYETCGGDISKKIMALLFSHTFPLRRRVPLNDIWEVFDEDKVARALQSPRKVQPGTFRKLLALGYPGQP